MPATPTYTKANFHHAKLLIVEKDDDQWNLFQQATRQHLPEVKIIRASSPTHMVSLLAGWQHQEWDLPKLLLIDLHLPALTDGWQLLRQIKSMSINVSRIPVVVVSSSTIQGDIEETYKLGSSSYLIKPTELSGWQSLVDNLRIYWWETITLPPLHYGS